MATVLGAGTLLFATFARVDACSAPVPSACVSEPEPEPVDVEAFEAGDLLARVSAVLNGAARGLSLAEIRSRVAESTARLQRAIAVGLRTRRLRRIGAHNGLRYVLNA
jgi:hypothetical protein